MLSLKETVKKSAFIRPVPIKLLSDVTSMLAVGIWKMSILIYLSHFRTHSSTSSFCPLSTSLKFAANCFLNNTNVTFPATLVAFSHQNAGRLSQLRHAKTWSTHCYLSLLPQHPELFKLSSEQNWQQLRQSGTGSHRIHEWHHRCRVFTQKN